MARRGRNGTRAPGPFALLGEIAESATYVRQRVLEDRVFFDVVTGMLGPDAHFAPHGHTLRLEISLG